MANRAQIFLAAYRRTYSVTKAARAAKISRAMHYRRLLSDRRYAAAFAQAQREAAQVLEDEAVRRAIEGVAEPVIYRGEVCRKWVRDKATGELRPGPPLVIRRYSDALLIRLLQAANPAKYRENYREGFDSPENSSAPLSIEEQRLRCLTDEELEELRRIARKLVSA